MTKFPCRDCERRTPGCHGHCADYLTAAQKNDDLRQARSRYLEKATYRGGSVEKGQWSNKMSLGIVPMTLKEANAFVERNHRHHKAVAGHKFSIGCSDGVKIVGVAIVGRPVSRYLDDGWTLEVTRLCTDGTKNVCSLLYAAAWRAARAMGYKKIVTYVLDSESGTSVKAAGYKCAGKAGGERWTGKRRPKVDLYPAQMKMRWEQET